MIRKSHFIGGALILAAAGLLSKVIGMFYRIPLQEIVGNNGLGLYQEVYPLYLTFLILATAGVPIALSRFIAEAIAESREDMIKQILAKSLFMMGLIGFVLFVLLYASSPLLAHLMGNKHLVEPIRALSFSLLFVPLIAVLRGFFYGQQKMLYVGISQVIEQILRVAMIMIVALYLVSLGEGTDEVITGVNYGTMVSSMLSLAVLVAFYFWHERKSPKTRFREWSKLSSLTDTAFYKKMWLVAWPICISALVIPIFSLVDSFLAINIFRHIWHVDGFTADTWFGIYSRGGPLLQLASLFGASIALSIVPAITEAKHKGDLNKVSTLTKLSYRFAWLIGLPAGLGLTAVAEGANLALYGDAEGTRAIAILGISAISLSILLATNGILQGLGREKTPAKHLVWGIGVKIISTVICTSFLGIDGLALSWLLSTFFVCYLNMRTIAQLVKVNISWKFDMLWPLVAANVMLILAWAATETVGHYLALTKLAPRIVGAGEAAAGVFVGLLVYVSLLLTVPLLHRDELDWLPGGKHLRQLMDLLRKNSINAKQ